MKRYWLFAGSCYYPSGGMGDYEGDFNTIEELHGFLMKTKGIITGIGHIY